MHPAGLRRAVAPGTGVSLAAQRTLRPAGRARLPFDRPRDRPGGRARRGRFRPRRRRHPRHRDEGRLLAQLRGAGRQPAPGRLDARAQRAPPGRGTPGVPRFRRVHRDDERAQPAALPRTRPRLPGPRRRRREPGRRRRPVEPHGSRHGRGGLPRRHAGGRRPARARRRPADHALQPRAGADRGDVTRRVGPRADAPHRRARPAALPQAGGDRRRRTVFAPQRHPRRDHGAEPARHPRPRSPAGADDGLRPQQPPAARHEHLELGGGEPRVVRRRRHRGVVAGRAVRLRRRERRAQRGAPARGARAGDLRGFAAAPRRRLGPGARGRARPHPHGRHPGDGLLPAHPEVLDGADAILHISATT